MINAYFDTQAFLAAVDQVRQERKASWYEVFRQTGICYTTFKKLQAGTQKGMSVHTLAGLALWSGLNTNEFMKNYNNTEEPHYTYDGYELFSNGNGFFSATGAKGVEGKRYQLDMFERLRDKRPENTHIVFRRPDNIVLAYHFPIICRLEATYE